MIFHVILCLCYPCHSLRNSKDTRGQSTPSQLSTKFRSVVVTCGALQTQSKRTVIMSCVIFVCGLHAKFIVFRQYIYFIQTVWCLIACRAKRGDRHLAISLCCVLRNHFIYSTFCCLLFIRFILWVNLDKCITLYYSSSCISVYSVI